MNISRRLRLLIIAAALATTGACDRPAASHAATPETTQERPQRTVAASSREHAVPIRDLSVDESMGGHTLERHVGKTNGDLTERLRREPEISSASTYNDRHTAERSVGAALASAGSTLSDWQRRSGRRPNLVLHFADPAMPVGRSLSRGRRAPVPCHRIVVVLRWDEPRDRFYVLTSYPEPGR
jgi:hypothetical protein